MSPEMEADFKTLKSEYLASGLASANLRISELEEDFKNFDYWMKGVKQIIQTLLDPVEGLISLLTKKVDTACTYGRDASINTASAKTSAKESAFWMKISILASVTTLILISITVFGMVKTSHDGMQTLMDKSLNNLANQTAVMELFKQSIEQNKKTQELLIEKINKLEKQNKKGGL